MNLTFPMMLWLALGTVIVAGTAWVLVARMTTTRRAAVSNLYNATPRAVAIVETPEAPILTRPRDGLVQRVARSLTPGALVRRLELKHSQAGRPSWSVGRILALKLVWLPVGAGLSVGLMLASGSPLLLPAGLAVTALGCLYPEVRLDSMAKDRAAAIRVELADTLDQMTIVVSAGEGFDSALAHAARNGTGALAAELTRTLQDIAMGQTRKQALEGLMTRVDVPDLKNFVRTVLAAERQGIALESVLKAQAGDMRRKRRERAKIKAASIPVKQTIPTIVLLVPAMLIPLLAPAVISAIGQFGAL